MPRKAVMPAPSRDDFLGRKGNLSSRRPGSFGGRLSIVQAARGVDARIPNESLAPVGRTLRKTGITQSRPGGAFLTFEPYTLFGQTII
jgi:hypothetical protein